MVFPRFGNPRRILRVLPQASRFLANLWLPAPRRSTKEDLLQKCAEACPRHRPEGLPRLVVPFAPTAVFSPGPHTSRRQALKRSCLLRIGSKTSVRLGFV